MSIDFVDFSAESRRIRLTGRLDIEGVKVIEDKLSELVVGDKSLLVVDLSKVEYLGSLGIRAIIFNAKARQKRGGKLVVFVGDNEEVAQTLELTGVKALVPVFSDWSEAQQALIWNQ